MTQFKPGDRVDVVIRGAEIMSCPVGDTRIIIQKPWAESYRRTTIDTNHPSVEVTLCPPVPQAGEVWGGVCLQSGGELTPLWIHDGGLRGAFQAQSPGGSWWQLEDLDFTNAVRLYPPTDSEGDK